MLPFREVTNTNDNIMRTNKQDLCINGGRQSGKATARSTLVGKMSVVNVNIHVTLCGWLADWPVFSIGRNQGCLSMP